MLRGPCFASLAAPRPLPRLSVCEFELASSLMMQVTIYYIALPGPLDNIESKP